MSAPIVEKVERFVTTGRGEFPSLALEAFRFQIEHLEPYRRLCTARGVSPEGVTAWHQVPAVPATAFKQLELATAPAEEVFASSGTTGEARSRHHQPFPELYRKVIEASFPRFALPHLTPPVPLLSLVPSRDQLPDSSLSFMVDHLLARFGDAASTHAFGTRRVELPRARSWLGARQRGGRAGVILGTALALDQLLGGLERMGLRFRLPAGSVVFETGGLKARTTELTRRDLLERLEGLLGVPPSMVLTEYGMTELTSQCYSPNLLDPTLPVDPDRPPLLVAPPWVRVRVLDPESLEELPAGETGLIAIFDLANLGSAVHLLTEDLGAAEPGGEAFRLHGRAAGAALRGCSLAVEAMAGSTP